MAQAFVDPLGSQVGDRLIVPYPGMVSNFSVVEPLYEFQLPQLNRIENCGDLPEGQVLVVSEHRLVGGKLPKLSGARPNLVSDRLTLLRS